MVWASTSSGRIELNIKRTDAECGSHQGRCDDDISFLRKLPYLKKQLEAIDAELLRSELREYGAWEDDELLDHENNLNRILWLLCGDIVDMI